MKSRYFILLALIFCSALVKAQPPETIYPGTVVYEGYYDDRSWGPFNIGFNFTFYGNSYSQMHITSNGLVMFGSGSNDYTEDPIPTAGAPNNFIAAFWDDIVIDPSGKILYTTIGAAPNRKCIIQWTNMGFYNSTVLMGTFSVILYEGSNNIQVQYRSIIDNTSDRSHGSSAVIGLENSTGTAGVQYAFHNSTAIASEQAILFTPSGSSYNINSSATYDGVYLTKNITLPEPGIPRLISPAKNAVIGSAFTFQWSAASNASSYTLKISKNSDISSSTNYDAATATTYNITGLTLNTTYYWAVFAVNSSGTTWSEIYRFTTSANPPLATVPQTIWMEQNEERSIMLQYTGGDASAKTAIITSLPAQGSLYQYIAGSKGTRISTVPTTLTDANRNVIYVADGGTGNGAGNFNFYIHDNTGDSPSGTTTINVNPPGIPNFILSAKSGNIEIQFDKPMSDPTGKQSQFTVKVNGTPVTISSVSLKAGDPYTIAVSLATPLTGSETVLISYTQGDVAAESGGLLQSFVDQPVNFLLQTITFPALPVLTYGDAPYTLTATASSGLPVTFISSNTTVASISGDQLTANSTGTAEITAQQIGNGTYAPAKYIRTLTVNKANQTITFPALPSKTYGDVDFNPGASSSSGLTVTYSSDNPAVATIVSGIIHIAGAGSAVITASQEGNNLYNAAMNQVSTLVVSKANQTITFPALPSKIYGDADFNPGASSSSGLAVTYSSSNPAVATIVSGNIHITGVGSAVITASQAGNTLYNAAPDQSSTLNVGKASQTISFPALPAKTYGDADFNPGATSSSGLTVTYTSGNPAVATIVGGNIHITGVGSAVITASQAGNALYNAASDQTSTLNVSKANQAITFPALPAKTYGDTDFNPGATSSSGLTVTYSSSNPAVATIVSGNIHITGVGSAVITASQAGNALYNAAPDQTSTLNVGKASQTITFPALPAKSYGDADFNPGATSSSGLLVTYSSNNAAVAIIVAGNIHITGAGTAVITASQAGNSLYNAAVSQTSTLTVAKAGQTITFPGLPSKTYGDADFNPGATSSSGLQVTYSSSNPAVATIVSGNIHIIGAGTAVITASQAGNTLYNAAPDQTSTLNVAKANQTISFPALPSKAYGDADFNPGATSSSGLPVSYSSSNPAVATIVSGSIHITGAGSAIITASQGGDSNYNAAANHTSSLVVSKAGQTITFAAIPSKMVTDPDFAPGASSSSGLTVTYSSSNPAVATVNGNLIHIVSAGTSTITASQAGNSDFNAAPDAAQLLTVTKSNQTITFTAIPAKTFGDPDFNPGATASSGLPVTYTSDNPDVATVSGTMIHIVNAGSATITANQAGDADFNPAPDETRVLTVNKASQVITFAAPAIHVFGDPDFDPMATASSGLAVTYSSSNTDVAVISGGMIRITGAGSTIITASQEGNQNWLTAPVVTQSLTVSKQGQTITFPELPSARYGDSDVTPAATASSGLAVAYSSSNTSVAVISGGLIHITGAGTTVITASQPGNDDFGAAPDVIQSFTVDKADQTITFGPLAEATYGWPDIDPGATASSGLQVTYSSSNPGVASIVAGMIRVNGAGTALITASQAGNTNYNAALDVQVTLSVSKADQTITFAPIDEHVFGDPAFGLSATSSSGLTVVFSSSDPSIAEINGQTVTIKGAGVVTVTASQPGDETFKPAADVTHIMMIKKAAQTISFDLTGQFKAGDPDITPNATATSGLAVTFTSSNESVASVSGNVIHITGAGTAEITASQEGDNNYEEATPVTVQIIVSRAGQAITFPPIPEVVYGAEDFSPGASSSSGLPITYSSDNPSVAEISGGFIRVKGTGTAVITAAQPGDESFDPSEQVQQTVTVTKAMLTVTAENKSKAYLSAIPVLTFTYSGFVYGESASVIDTEPSASTDAQESSAVGDYPITVGGGSDDNYDFTYIDGTLAITKIPQSVSFTAFPLTIHVNETFQLEAAATSGLAVTYESQDPQVARVTGSELTGVSNGTVVIRAYQQGDDNYSAAEATITVEVISSFDNILHLFTPNNDGFNDRWEIPDLGSYGKCDVRVYNRWGKLVFKSPDYHNEWDGTSNGADLPAAAYYYVIKTENSGTLTGTVNIVR